MYIYTRENTGNDKQTVDVSIYLKIKYGEGGEWLGVWWGVWVRVCYVIEQSKKQKWCSAYYTLVCINWFFRQNLPQAFNFKIVNSLSFRFFFFFQFFFLTLFGIVLTTMYCMYKHNSRDFLCNLIYFFMKIQVNLFLSVYWRTKLFCSFQSRPFRFILTIVFLLVSTKG